MACLHRAREISAENLDVGGDSHLPIISKEHVESYEYKTEWNLFQSSLQNYKFQHV